MQSKNGFVASLFVMAMCALTAGGIGLYKNIEYRLYGQEATMELADPTQKIVQFDDVLDTRTIDVKYVSSAGEVVVPGKVVTKDVFDKLVAGQKIPMTYLTSRPNRVFYAFQQPPIPWVWLLIGVITSAVAVYALRLRKREAKA